MGFVSSNAVALQSNALTEDVPISIAEISCVGIEEAIRECHFVTTTDTIVKCTHTQDLYVKCLSPEKCNKLSAEFPLLMSPMDSSVPVGTSFYFMYIL